jgi:PTS system nitrogen regulatory IIA component
MIPIAPYLDPSRVLDLSSTTREEAITELCEFLRGTPAIGDLESFRRAVLDREKVMSTGIGLGIAVPHAKIASVKEFVLAVGRSREGIDFASLDGRPVHIVVLIAGPEEKQARYLQILAGVTLRLKDEQLRRAVREAAGPEEVVDLLSR